MTESQQKVLSRVRPPRVQITYDVETLGSIQKKELPFIVGILADLAGKLDPANPPTKLKERKFVEIDRDNFDAVMKNIGPKLGFEVANRMQPGATSSLSVSLTFEAMAEFNPTELVKKIPELEKLVEARCRLNDLLAKLDGNDELDGLLTEILSTPAEQTKLSADWTASKPAATLGSNAGGNGAAGTITNPGTH